MFLYFFIDECDITLDSLKIITTLGKGGFARVDLVHQINKPSQTFAMKCVKKQYVVDTNHQQHIMNERNLMLKCNNQFICRYLFYLHVTVSNLIHLVYNSFTKENTKHLILGSS